MNASPALVNVHEYPHTSMCTVGSFVFYNTRYNVSENTSLLFSNKNLRDTSAVIVTLNMTVLLKLHLSPSVNGDHVYLC